MSETFYRKVGRRYKPILEYAPELFDGFPEGSHLVVSEPGHRLTRFNVDPTFAPVLAAIASGKDALIQAIMKASASQPRERKLTKRELAAFEAWKKAMGEEVMYLSRPSAEEIFKAFELALVGRIICRHSIKCL